MMSFRFLPCLPFRGSRGATRGYHAMIKALGAICNLDCTYCYYLHKEDLLGSPSKFRISDEILETHIKQYIEGQSAMKSSSPGKPANPRYSGWSSFAKWSNSNKNTRSPSQRIENDLQTNGTLLDDEWGVFLKQHGFLVGLSIDGPQELHDQSASPKTASPPLTKCLPPPRCSIVMAFPSTRSASSTGSTQAAARRLPLPEE